MPIVKGEMGSQAVRAFRAKQASIFCWKLRETKPFPGDPIENPAGKGAE